MHDCAAIPFLALALMGLAVAARYLRTPTFMPYQQRATGKKWEQLDPGLQTVLLAMFRFVGGAFLSLGVAMAWVAYAVHVHIACAPWAALSVGFAGLAPALSATLLLRRYRPGSRPPTVLALAALALLSAGVLLSLLAQE